VRINIAQPSFRGNEKRYLLEVLRSTRLSMGEFVERFEKRLGNEQLGYAAVTVASGTAALHLALLALGLKPGQRVIVPACSYIATANAVRYCGATPIFVDVDPKTWTLPVEAALEAAEQHRAAGVILVDLYGTQAAGRRQAFPSRAWVLQDACEAHGVPMYGDATVLSFYGNKIITCGEGGAVLSNDESVIDRVKKLRGQGQSARRYVHDVLGFNYRMTDLQAAIGLAQLERLHDMLRVRRAVRFEYDSRLLDVRSQWRSAYAVEWVMPILVSDRQRVADALFSQGEIETRPVFPALNTQPIYRGGERMPVAEELARDGLLLPLHAEIGTKDVESVCALLSSVLTEVAA